MHMVLLNETTEMLLLLVLCYKPGDYAHVNSHLTNFAPDCRQRLLQVNLQIAPFPLHSVSQSTERKSLKLLPNLAAHIIGY